MVQRVLVTGAASGIGQAVARRFDADGADVACLDIDLDGATATAEGLGGRGHAEYVDVRDEVAVGEAVERALQRLGGLDVLVNAAGVGGFANTTDMTLADWQRIIDINLTGTFLMCRAALPALEDGGGGIVNVASSAGLSGRAYGAAYCASKAGVVMLTRSLALEYGGRGVRANCVCPGAVDTPLLEQFGLPEGADGRVVSKGGVLGRIAAPSEIAAAIFYLASPDAAYITGSSMVLDGGAGA